MAKKKLLRFADLPRLTNVCQDPHPWPGQWKKEFFKNENPITLELACGKGEYTVGLAQRFPDRNFLGVDIKGARIWVGATRALELGLSNAGFVRTAIEDIHLFFAENEIHEIWITFPDPHPTFGKRKKRLTSPRFLALYRKILKPGGILHLKTDDDILYQFTQQTLAEEGAAILQNIDDVYGKTHANDLLPIQTKYEKKHLKDGKKIKYIQFRLEE